MSRRRLVAFTATQHEAVRDLVENVAEQAEDGQLRRTLLAALTALELDEQLTDRDLDGTWYAYHELDVLVTEGRRSDLRHHRNRAHTVYAALNRLIPGRRS